MDTFEKHMREALTLARQGMGAVEPNPMVGAVITRDGQILGRGWHKSYGGPHAEVEALADARRSSQPVAGATMVVTLEPCCHHGKTPPCTQAILAAGITRVIVSVFDPFEQVSGGGVQTLRQAGVEVVEGVLAQEGRELLGAYLKLRTRGRPWVICKWAQTLDGRIAARTGDSRWISSDRSRQRVHELRACCDGVVVGISTALADDPLLTNRTGDGRQPARIVLDRGLRLPADSQLARSVDQAPLLVATTTDAIGTRSEAAAALRAAGAELLPLPSGPSGVDLPALLDELGRREWTRILVEGGGGVLGSFLEGELADELVVFVAPKILGGVAGVPPVRRAEVDTIAGSLQLPTPTVEAIDGDLLLRYRFPEA